MSAAARSEEHAGSAVRKFVCVFNRARDSYQVPLGLHEAGLLERLVTDFYAPDRPSFWLPRFLRRRRHEGLPARRIHSDRLAFAVQYAAELLRLPLGPTFRWVGRRLGRTTGRLARRRNAHLYCYHEYLPPKVADDQCLIVFVFHPLPELYAEMLALDHAAYPEVDASFQEDRRASASFFLPVPWTRPDAIVCASGVTARSVVAAGAPAERIAVIPYGLPAAAPFGDLSRRRSGAPRFLFVGNGVQRKGIHHLLRAWQARPRGEAELVVVCYDLDQGIAALATDPSIRLLGYQTRDDLDRLFASSDVFVMPSMLEGFGLVYLEALSFGCHLIATPNTGVPDLHLSSDAATLVQPGHLEQLDRVIDECSARVAAGGYDRAAIAAEGARWTQADFRRAIADHAAAILAWREGRAAYPDAYRYSP